MSTLAVLPLLAGVASCTLGFLVITSGRDNGSRLPFFLFAISMGVWAILISLFLSATNPVFARWCVAGYYVAALVLIYGFLLFCLSIARKRTAYTIRHAGLLALPVVIVSAVIIGSDLLIEDVSIGPLNTAQLDTVWYAIYCALFVAYAILAFISLIRTIAGERKGVRRSQHVLIARVMCVCLPGGAFFNLALPLIGDYRLIMVGPLFALPIVVVVFYAIMRHSLFDVRLAFVRTVTYILSLTTLTGVYSLLTFAMSELVIHQHVIVLNQSVVTVTLVLVLSFIFHPIKRFFDRWTNRIFYRDNYSNDEFFTRLNRVLTSTTDLRVLLERTATEIGATLQAEQAYFFLYFTDQHYVSAGTKQHTRLPIEDVAILDKYIEQHGNQVITADLFADSAPVRRLMISHKLALILPLLQANRVTGYLCLGEQRSRGYTTRDSKALATVADELVIAIQNALSVQQVRELNATLQQRIDEATKELRHSNAQLQKLDQAKDEFVSMASHQLRTPLTSVKGYIDMVLEGDAGKITDMQRHLLGEAFTSSERMVHLINDFLNVSRLQTGKFMIDRRPVDLATIVAQEVDGLKTTAAQRQLQLSYKLSSKIPMLYLDEGKLRQVIMNFIDNAIYYSKEGTSIKVVLSADETNISLTVKDTGIGVPESEQANLFAKFFRATNARRQRPDGTGVGLYLAKKVIVAHGGTVQFESSEGKGSTFGFLLPIKRLQSAPVDDTNNLNS
jgi:signal transduction histidine kinase